MLVQTDDLAGLLKGIGRLHGRTSFDWNGEEHVRGRKVFYRAVDRAMRTNRHFWTTVNYVHNNPVRHGYVKRWEDWPWSSAIQALSTWGHAETLRIWREYPLYKYGDKWDPPNY